jgi:ABC-2 type transport system permease protein
MKVLTIARKMLLELLREPLLVGLLLFFPAALVAFYYFAFRETDAGLTTYLSLLVMDDDAGVSMVEGETEGAAQEGLLESGPAGQAVLWRAGEDLVGALDQMEWEGDPVFKVEVVDDRRAAEIALREGKASLLLTIPADFSQSLMDVSTGVDGAVPATVSLLGDLGSDGFVFARSFLDGLIREFAQQTAGWEADTLTVAYELLPGTGTMSDFDFGVAGNIVFGIMFVIVTASTVLVRENVTGTLRRLRLTQMKAAELLVGATLAQMVLAVIQMLITFGAAVLMGFQNNGSVLLTIGIGLLLNLSAVGLGLVVACFARNDGEAANLASGVMVPMVFLSGALYPMPEAPIVTIAGRTIQIYDLLPATHASEAMRRVMVFGDGPGEIAYELVALALLSLVILAVGVVLYDRLQMRRA